MQQAKHLESKQVGKRTRKQEWEKEKLVEHYTRGKAAYFGSKD